MFNRCSYRRLKACASKKTLKEMCKSVSWHTELTALRWSWAGYNSVNKKAPLYSLYMYQSASYCCNL